MGSDKLRGDVIVEFFRDPKVDPDEIAVSAENEWTARRPGTIQKSRQKSDAQRGAERACGVTAADSELKVRNLDKQQPDDAGLRGDALQALMLDSLVPTGVDSQVTVGWVTLTGYRYLREDGSYVATNVLGVSCQPVSS